MVRELANSKHVGKVFWDVIESDVRTNGTGTHLSRGGQPRLKQGETCAMG